METIKRYKNRKLYSTKSSNYVTLAYIIDLVKMDDAFIVIDNKTKQDITGKVLKAALTTVNLDNNTVLNLLRSN